MDDRGLLKMTISDKDNPFRIRNKLFKKLAPKWTERIESSEAFQYKHESELVHPATCVLGEIHGGDTGYFGRGRINPNSCEFCNDWAILSFAVLHDSTNEQMNKDIDRLMRHVKQQHPELLK